MAVNPPRSEFVNYSSCHFQIRIMSLPNEPESIQKLVLIFQQKYTHHSFHLSHRFLLARHKAALEVYNEAAKMSSKDWVCIG